MLPSGFWKFLAHITKELEVLLRYAPDKSYCAKTTHNVFSENCNTMVERTAPLVITVTNPNARLCCK
jgi:ribosomal protein L32E